VAVGVVREEGMAVHVGDVGLGRQLNDALLDQRYEIPQRAPARRRIEVIQFHFESRDLAVYMSPPDTVSVR
jgi:hypothetical protein